MGMEVAILAAQPKLGRDMLLWNSIIFLIGAFVLGFGLLGQFQPNDMVTRLFYIVGISSIIGCAWLTITTRGLGNNTVPVLVMFGLWAVGAAIYFYMPLTSMTNPPMNWGYARTWDGFLHALSRGQYEKANPTNFFSDPGRLVMQLKLYFLWARDEFNLVNLSLAIVPLVFFFRLQKRERAWLIGLAGIWFCLAIVLLILLNPTEDKASQSLNKVFFASSYTAIAMYIGYGLSLIAASMVTQFQKFRLWGIFGGVFVFTLALYTLFLATDSYSNGQESFFHVINRSFAPNQFGLPIHGALILLGLAGLYVLINLVCSTKPMMIVTLAIFALLPANSIMSHWADNEQRNHWFGYYFGHDMFTPPFTDPKTGKLSYDNSLRSELLKTPAEAKGIYPEMARDAVLFGGTDPGRFCPTYMIFCDSIIPHDKQPLEDQKFDRRDVYIITQNALADPTYLEYIRAHYNRSTQIDPPFFQEMLRPKSEVDQGYKTNAIARLAYQILDKPFLSLGAKIEARRREEKIYPPKEIYTPTPEDSSRCFSEYMADASQRLGHDMQFPNEPKQIKPGEEVHQSQDNRVSVSGQVAVMSINGLLTKVIFDHNPDNEFYVEESFPLDWMYPYLSPFGVIMKINRQPMDEMSQEMVDKDHLFWSKYSERLVGSDVVTYDSTLKDIAAFVEKVYLAHDYTGFKGDLKFIREDTAQKAFSKLRSSIGGIYDWRFKHAKSATDQQRMLKEAEFAYRQAFAYYPASPEAVFRYVNLLLTIGRIDDALLVAETCYKLDPHNGQVKGLIQQLTDIKSHNGTMGQAPPPASLQQMEKEWHDNPTNFQAAFNLAGAYLQSQQKDKGMQILDEVLNSPNVDSSAIVFLAQAYAKFSDYPKLELTLEKLTKIQPHSPEAWCDLAAMKTALNKQTEALSDLRTCLDENAIRLKANPKAANMAQIILTDPRFNTLHSDPEYQKMLAPK
ncbi:MAG: hypothetical protein JWQ04_2530 [Pedosphaera sp.]|nr:hypothetical protein [Pedosphaera sp.]